MNSALARLQKEIAADDTSSLAGGGEKVGWRRAEGSGEWKD